MEALQIVPIRIEKTAEVCGGAPRISGTRVRVIDIAIPHRMGKSPEEITQMYAHISLAAVHTALAYYFEHRKDMDKEEKTARQLVQAVRKSYPSKAM